MGAKVDRPLPDLRDQLERERSHAGRILETNEENWGWSTPAGRIRWRRRVDFLLDGARDGCKRVLEIGAGTGTFTGALSAISGQLYALDVAESLLAVAKGRAEGVPLICADAHRLPFPDEVFDAVLGCSVLHHLRWDLAVAEFARVLRRGGTLRFSEPNLWNPQIFLQKKIPALKRMMGDSPDESAFTARTISRHLREAGFDRVDVRPYEFLHPSTPSSLIPAVKRLESWIMATPLRRFGGSLAIDARRG